MEFITSLIRLELISFEKDSIHLLLGLKINNKKYKFLLDTGASKTVINLNTVKKQTQSIKLTVSEQPAIGLGTNSHEVLEFKTTDIQIGDVIIKNHTLGVIDMQHVVDFYKQMFNIKLHGVLGSDILLITGAIIDYRDLTIKVLQK